MVLVGALMGHGSINTTTNYVGWAPDGGAEVVAGIYSRPDDELAKRRRRRTG